MKMKAEELRIGNYVQGEPLSIPRLNISSGGVTQITAYGIQLMAEDWLNFEPIPLTEKWLKDFGFEIKTNQVSIVADTYAKGKFWLYHDHETKSFEVGALSTLIIFKYVHQLQNFYYCITGEQLTII